MMKKIFGVGIISIMILSTICGVGAFGWSHVSPYYLCWYGKSDSSICRNISNIKSSIVTYGNSKKQWSQSEAETIQNKWFDLQSDSRYVNVIVQYTFSSSGDPNFVQSPWLAAGTPPAWHD